MFWIEETVKASYDLTKKVKLFQWNIEESSQLINDVYRSILLFILWLPGSLSKVTNFTEIFWNIEERRQIINDVYRSILLLF